MISKLIVNGRNMLHIMMPFSMQMQLQRNKKFLVHTKIYLNELLHNKFIL